MKSIVMSAALAGCVLASAQAVAAPFTTSGGRYVANLAHKQDSSNGQVVSVNTVLGGSAVSASGSHMLLNDYAVTSWRVNGLNTAGDTVATTFDLGEVFTLSQIHTEYVPFFDNSWVHYSLEVSTDNSSWTTVRAMAAAGGTTKNDNFAPTDGRYIRWNVQGSGAGDGAVFLQELMAYADATSANVPQTDKGYSVAPMTVAVTQTIHNPPTEPTGFISWGSATAMTDRSLNSDGAVNVGPTSAVLDLGSLIPLRSIQPSFYAGWDNLMLEVSPDNVNWTLVKPAGGTVHFTRTPYAVPTTVAQRYIRVTGTMGGANGHLRELTAFAFLPEPGSAAALLAGTMLMSARRRQRPAGV